MFNSSNSYSLADIAAATGSNRNGGEDSWGGNGSWWIIVLFLFCMMGGWNNNWDRNNGGNGSNGIIPMYQGNSTREEIAYAFDMNDLQSGVRGIQQGLCDGFYAQNSALANLNNNLTNAVSSLGFSNQQGFNNITQAVLQSQNAQTIAAMQNQNDLQAQISACCCDTKSNLKDINYQIATGICSVNTNNNNNTRDLLEAQNNNTREILQAIQQNKIDAMQDKITTLTAQNNQLALQASQQAQNAYLLNELKPCPIPAYITCSPYQTYPFANYQGCNCGN